MSVQALFYRRLGPLIVHRRKRRSVGNDRNREEGRVVVVERTPSDRLTQRDGSMYP